MNNEETFGEFIRRRRLEKQIGLRQMSLKIGVSATYLSKIERNEIPPPIESRIKKIASELGCDADELLARGGRVSSDLCDIIKSSPIKMAQLLRTYKSQEATARAEGRATI